MNHRFLILTTIIIFMGGLTVEILHVRDEHRKQQQQRVAGANTPAAQADQALRLRALNPDPDPDLNPKLVHATPISTISTVTTSGLTNLGISTGSSAYDDKRATILAALDKRKLTPDELTQLDPHLNIFSGQVYYPCEKYAVLYELLVTQWELQAGQKLPFHIPLSSRTADYNQCPQEYDNQRAVETVIAALQKQFISKPSSPQPSTTASPARTNPQTSP